MAFCRNCGEPLRDGIKFCPQCGNPVGQSGTGGQGSPGGYDAPNPPTPSNDMSGRQRLTDDRGLGMYIVLSIITVGIYYYYFIFRLAKDTNIVCADDGKHTRGLVACILLSMITFGIYSLYWEYTLMNRIAENAPAYGIQITETGSSVLIWELLGYVTCSICRFVALHIIIKNSNKLFHAYNEKYGL